MQDDLKRFRHSARSQEVGLFGKRLMIALIRRNAVTGRLKTQYGWHDGSADQMSIVSASPFRPHLQVLTEHTVPSPIFVVAWTGVNYWLRVQVPLEVLLMSRTRKLHEVGRIVRAHYAEKKGRTLPFGAITGYLLRTLPDRAIRFSVEGVSEGVHLGWVPNGQVTIGLRR